MSNYEIFKESEVSNIMDSKLEDLLTFPFLSKEEQEVLLHHTLKFQRISKNKYSFLYQNKRIPFAILKDFGLQKIDRTILKDEIYAILYNERLLKIFYSKNMPNSYVLIGTSDIDTLYPLIEYQENGTEKIMDYQSNLILKKSDYETLFHLKIKSRLDRVDIYQIYTMITELKCFHLLFDFLLSWPEIKKDLIKQSMFPILSKKFDRYGMNYANHTFLGDKSDVVFFEPEDFNAKYKSIRDELDDFTKKTYKNTEHIKICSWNHEPFYKLTTDFGIINFKLISDMITSSIEKRILLSENRYGFCHMNSQKMANAFQSLKPSGTYVVAGKVAENELDYINHSWVEIDASKSFVVDYNHNLFIEKESYYELYGAVALEKTSISEFLQNCKIIGEQFQINSSDFLLNYFSKEIVRDLQKNEFLLTKKKD